MLRGIFGKRGSTYAGRLIVNTHARWRDGLGQVCFAAGARRLVSKGCAWKVVRFSLLAGFCVVFALVGCDVLS